MISADVVQLALRSRFNPLRGLTPQLLSVYLDNFMLGFVAYAALVWDQIEKRDDIIRNVASKRKKALAKYKRKSFQREQTPEAQSHAQALDEFYDNITVVNALDQNETGGFPLLVRQMMDAVGKYYAVHEIVWQPGEILTAELRFVPLWFFENRSGRLQFLKLPLGGANGEPLEAGGWMITKGDGIMEACSIAYMFKNMPLKDWVSYSDKYGTPGVLGQTNAAKGSEAGEALKARRQAFHLDVLWETCDIAAGLDFRHARLVVVRPRHDLEARSVGRAIRHEECAFQGTPRSRWSAKRRGRRSPPAPARRAHATRSR
jgi:phage gp29-like protein